MKKYDILGVGSALLDITLEVKDNILDELGLTKGQMILVDDEKNKEILKKLENFPSKIFPGGSSANTIAGIGILGGKTGFIGRLGNDTFGKIYEEKTRECNVSPFFSKDNKEITGNTITFITPDKERTFAVNLGASLFLSKEDIKEELIKQTKILHLEGYMLQDKKLKEVLVHLIELAKKNNIRISIDLCDAGLVKNDLSFLKNILDDIDIIFANEQEVLALTGKSSKEAIHHISESCRIIVFKLGSKGSIIKHNKNIYEISGVRVEVINTNGAGDMYAAGLLYGISRGFDLKRSGELASFAASLVVRSPGARLEKDLIIELNNYKKEKGI